MVSFSNNYLLIDSFHLTFSFLHNKKKKITLKWICLLTNLNQSCNHHMFFFFFVFLFIIVSLFLKLINYFSFLQFFLFTVPVCFLVKLYKNIGRCHCCQFQCLLISSPSWHHLKQT